MGAAIQSVQTVLGHFPADKGSLIPILQRVQAREGYISSRSAWEISQALRLTESQVYGVASFYSQFRFTPPGRNRFHVCLGTACHVRGGQPCSTPWNCDLASVRVKPHQTESSRLTEWPAWDAALWPRWSRSAIASMHK